VARIEAASLTISVSSFFQVGYLCSIHQVFTTYQIMLNARNLLELNEWTWPILLWYEYEGLRM